VLKKKKNHQVEGKDPSYDFLKLHLTKEQGRREMARTVGRISSKNPSHCPIAVSLPLHVS
jgi:hypothetical protein